MKNEALDIIFSKALRNRRAEPLPLEILTDTALQHLTYHGIAGKMVDEDLLANWPDDLSEQVRAEARGQAMWELQHAAVLRPLLESFAESNIPTILLKGTALAYDLYESPAERARADTDLLIHERNLQRARTLLTDAGFDAPSDRGFLPPELRYQESWLLLAPDKSTHCIDLHWRVLNTPAVDRMFSVDEWFEGARPLPRLSAAARVPSHPLMLLHALLHRGLHECAPYFVGDETYFGGNRLIWLWDIALIGRSMSEDEWRDFCRLAQSKGVAGVCQDGLVAARDHVGPVAPEWVEPALMSKSSRYFSGGQLRRAWLDWCAIGGTGRKVRYLIARAFPSASFMRAKYPALSDWPLSKLYLRRLVELARPRP